MISLMLSSLSFSQIQIADVGDGWKNKVQQALDTIQKYDTVKYNNLITVCDNAKERCPFFLTKASKFHYNFPDPAKATGTEEEIKEQFRQVRQQIKDYCKQFIEDNL